MASVGIYQSSYADTTVIGKDYTDVTNPDGSHTLSTHYPYFFDGNNWVPFVQNGNEIKTDTGNILLNADGSFTWTNKGITDTIKAKYADISNLNSWTYPNTLNNDIPDISWNGTALVSSKVKTGVGQLDYKYVFKQGVWKTQLEATNLSGLTSKAFGFDEIFDINRDTLKFGTNTVNLDNYNGTTFNKNWIDSHESKVIDLLNGVNYDFDIAYDNLYSITVYDTGVNKSQLVFDYRTSTPLLPGQTLILDPTFGPTSATAKTVNTSNSIAASCAAGSSTNGNTFDVYKGNSGVNDKCNVGVPRWDITTIPDTATVSDITIGFGISSVLNMGSLSCTYKQMTNDPNSASAATLFTDANDGTTYATDTGCRTTGAGKTISLSSTARTDLQTILSGGTNWLSYGIAFDSMTRDASAHQTEGVTGGGPYAVTLTVTYSTASPPNPVTSVWVSNIGTNSLKLNWSPPTSFGGGTFQTYTVNYTTPWGAPVTFKQNSTALNANVTGLTFGTDYSFRIAARTEVTGNTTGAYILNTTTTSNTYSTPPTGLTVAAHGHPTQLDLQWVAGAMQNVLGYKIQRETPIGTGWTTIVSNTTNTNVYYNNTGLSTNIDYNYRVYALNGSGISTASNVYDMTTFHLPNAITDLTATASDFTTVALSWSAPTSYAPSITGYRVNYTTPTGTPLTIQTPDPYTTTTNAIIYGLTAGDDYSFRVTAITIHGKNATGNIYNVTTSNLFTPGQINPLISANTADFSIFYTRTDTNSTSTTLDVTYPNTYNLNCNFQYQFAGLNDTYTSLAQTVVDTDNVKSTFIFNDPQNDVINVRCYDTITDDEAKYVLVINQFPFLDQITNMRNGTYGTYFQVGAIDGVTLMICILAMIGFNRTNPIAGIMFLVITVGVLSWFGIITYPIIMYPALALLAVWAFISTRKDD